METAADMLRAVAPDLIQSRNALDEER